MFAKCTKCALFSPDGCFFNLTTFPARVVHALCTFFQRSIGIAVRLPSKLLVFLPSHLASVASLLLRCVAVFVLCVHLFFNKSVNNSKHVTRKSVDNPSYLLSIKFLCTLKSGVWRCVFAGLICGRFSCFQN